MKPQPKASTQEVLAGPGALARSGALLRIENLNNFVGGPVMQSRGITLSFHREMADSSRELVALKTNGSANIRHSRRTK
jgi:hypothetical protein